MKINLFTFVVLVNDAGTITSVITDDKFFRTSNKYVKLATLRKSSVLQLLVGVEYKRAAASPDILVIEDKANQ